MLIRLNDYLLNVLFSLVFVESLKEIAQIQLFTDIVDFLIMLVMCVFSRLLTNFISRYYKRFVVKLLNRKK
jgi:hypothetical protein